MTASSALARSGAGARRRYRPRPWFFTRSERSCYRALVKAVDEHYEVFPKVRLLDLCADLDNDYGLLNPVSAKHVDFVLCDRVTLRPIVAIEVDGLSHARASRAMSDAVKNAFFAEIGLPLIRLPATRWVEPGELLRRIDAAIALA